LSVTVRKVRMMKSIPRCHPYLTGQKAALMKA
jgi:hypothetical protein